MIVGLIVSQLTLIGLMGIKQVPGQATVLLPLPFMTLAFMSYCHKAFERKSEFLPLEESKDVDKRRKEIALEQKDQSLQKQKDQSLQKGGTSSDDDSQEVYVNPALLAEPIIQVAPENIVLQGYSERAITVEDIPV